MVTPIIYVHGSPIVLEGGIVIMRLMKHGGVMHAVWRTSRLFMDLWHTPPIFLNLDPVIITETLCQWRTNLPWRRTKRFRETQVNCMECLVRMSRL